MRTLARFAYGNSRVRARKSRLLSPALLVTLAAAERPETAIEGWRDIEPDGDAGSLVALVYTRLMAHYDAVIRAYPAAAPVLRALARLHELENVKLTWRAAASGLEPGWPSWWRPMGPLETVSRSRCTAVSSLTQMSDALSRSSFAEIAARVARAHGADLAAAEMAFDRWGSQMLVAAAEALPPRAHAARDLAHGVVGERDVAVLERAAGSLGVAVGAAVRTTSLLANLLGAAALRQIAEWSAAGGAPLSLPRRFSADGRPVRTFAELRRAMHRARRAACQRVFLGTPFSVAPALAFVLLAEDEVHALISMGELRAAHASRADAVRVLEGDG